MDINVVQTTQKYVFTLQHISRYLCYNVCVCLCMLYTAFMHTYTNYLLSQQYCITNTTLPWRHKTIHIDLSHTQVILAGFAPAPVISWHRKALLWVIAGLLTGRKWCWPMRDGLCWNDCRDALLLHTSFHPRQAGLAVFAAGRRARTMART